MLPQDEAQVTQTSAPVIEFKSIQLWNAKKQGELLCWRMTKIHFGTNQTEMGTKYCLLCMNNKLNILTLSFCNCCASFPLPGGLLKHCIVLYNFHIILTFLEKQHSNSNFFLMSSGDLNEAHLHN